MPAIFLSYSRDDQAIARLFAEGFERAGFSVWWDQTLSAGEAYDKVTEKALKDAKAVVVLWSKKSVDSRWVRAEATMADRNKTLVPVMIEACERPIMFELTHTEYERAQSLPGTAGLERLFWLPLPITTVTKSCRWIFCALRWLTNKTSRCWRCGKATKAAAVPTRASRPSCATWA